jgi:hypothetical protein
VQVSLYGLNSRHKVPGKKQLTKQTAVQIIQNEYPEMKKYPGDQLPPESIRTETSDDGWYVAFVEEGSGRPIISDILFC